MDRRTEAARTFEETCLVTDYSLCLGLNCESATEVDTTWRCFGGFLFFLETCVFRFGDNEVLSGIRKGLSAPHAYPL